MKILLLGLLFGSVVAGCKKEAGPTNEATTLGQPFTLASQQSTGLPMGSGGPVQVVLTHILDARCTGQCLWEGYVAVTVTLTDASNAPQTARLALSRIEIPPYVRDSVAVTLNQRAYWLRLLAVNGPVNAADQTATLRLRPQ